MSKFVTGRLLAIAVVVSLAACSKQETAETAAPASAPGNAGEVASQPHPDPSEATASIDLSGLEKAEGGQTVAEVFAAKEQLEGETVLIRGKVVKVNANIMGKNWLHVRDGSGEEGTNDLTITSAGAVPAVGDTVLVTGTLGLNRDFGMGYQYPVIVEDAEVTVEMAAE
ncbi:MAG: hypothetical protein PVH13_10175 [Gammaproteobacteria bacterium]